MTRNYPFLQARTISGLVVERQVGRVDKSSELGVPSNFDTLFLPTGKRWWVRAHWLV